MGSEFHHYCFEGNLEDLDTFHSDYQHEECNRYGHDTYAGHLGTLTPSVQIINKPPFSTEEDAVKYIEDNHSKWHSAMAVPFKGKVYAYNAASQKILIRRRKAEDDLLKLKRTIMKQIKSTKSKTIGCRNCGSSVARRFLNNSDCPVCYAKEVFYSNTQTTQIASKVSKLEQLHKHQKLTRVIKPGINYAVGGWCPC